MPGGARVFEDPTDPSAGRSRRPALRLILHRGGAPALRLGLGPDLCPVGAMRQLQALLDRHSFWAVGRSRSGLRRMLRGSAAAVTAWEGRRLVGFGRATSDGPYRAVLWDVVVADSHQGQGVGRSLVERLLAHPTLRCTERVYLMTTESSGFYERLGFREATSQRLMIKRSSG